MTAPRPTKQQLAVRALKPGGKARIASLQEKLQAQRDRNDRALHKLGELRKQQDQDEIAIRADMDALDTFLADIVEVLGSAQL